MILRMVCGVIGSVFHENFTDYAGFAAARPKRRGRADGERTFLSAFAPRGQLPHGSRLAAGGGRRAV